jgi:RHS repeat-associated protein
LDLCSSNTCICPRKSDPRQTSYTYDASGNRTEAAIGGTATVTATYNGAEQLTSYDNAAADMTAATYDGDGLRSSATSTPSGGGSSTEHFVWDTTSSVPALLMDSDNAYIYGPSGTPFEQVNLSTGTITYLVSDALGSVRGVVSSAGSLTASTSYDAWGNPETTGGLMAETPFGFAGGYTDQSGLLYLIHRYYDPATGQFLTVDPMADETGQPYAYTGDDPVNGVDPLGLCIPGLGAVCDVIHAVTGGIRDTGLVASGAIIIIGADLTASAIFVAGFPEDLLAAPAETGLLGGVLASVNLIGIGLIAAGLHVAPPTAANNKRFQEEPGPIPEPNSPNLAAFVIERNGCL